ncbi:type II toxin-antitoxin system RelB family antitoxin [Subtercola boreus]|uniref:type II toxin-antitoxin system RelB family antitoxin n=1 Tax=Subtercola boreus TaxID=120213 RepID=UPI001C0F11BE|nr:ribbon-helix-helix protein, CopG family [Subtercola boreus]
MDAVAGGVVVGVLLIRLPDEDIRRLEALAARTGKSKTFYVREAVRAYLADVEERYWADGVIDRWEASDQVSRPAVVLWAGCDA